MKNVYTIVNTEKTEIVLSDQFCELEKYPFCKNNKYSLNEPIVKICAIEKGYWERLVNIDEQRIVLFPSNFNEIQFKENIDVPFHILEKKFKYDFLIAMSHLKNI